MSRKGALTDLQIGNAKPRSKKYTIAGGKGLTLVVMPDGAKYWRLRYRYADRGKDVSLGKPYPETTLAEAEDRAVAYRNLLKAGIDPAERRREEKAAIVDRANNTFRKAADAWHEYRRGAWKPITAEQVRAYLDKDLIAKFGDRPLDSISAKELSNFTGEIAKRGAPDVAKKARQWLKSIYSYARMQGWATTDPMNDWHPVVLTKQEARNYPHIQPSELPDFLKALDADTGSPLVKGALMMALWTANRPGVTRTLRWSELDLDSALWRIPKGRESMKRGYKHDTPLPRQAVEMLREIYPFTKNFEYVFAGRNDPRSPLSDGAIALLLKRIGYRGKQTAHGFRHLLSTALNELGYEPDWIERQLAHGDPDTIRGTYNKAQYLTQRTEMLQTWADFLDQMRRGESWGSLARRVLALS